jgi:hypothetical protein
MSYQPHYIASYEDDSGLNTYYEPFILPEKAFPVLQDAYCWRGKVQRRRGFELLGRLRRVLVNQALTKFTSAGPGAVVENIFTDMALAGLPETNATLQPGTVANPIVVTVGAQTITDTLGDGTTTVAGAGPITSATINYNTGDLSIVYSGAMAPTDATISVAYWPGFPVMGLRTQEEFAINNENLIAFDQKYAYKYDPSSSQFVELVPGTTWNGLDYNFFWSTNYYNDLSLDNLFWVTNTSMASSPKDPIRYFDGSAWHDFAPVISNDGVNSLSLYQCEIILPYKNCLVVMNTWEGKTGSINNANNFPRRIRWSAPAEDPNATNAWREDIPGEGSYLDIPSADEVIVSAEFIKDVLVIKCERSTWKLVWTNISTDPFLAQMINTELGAESKFSLIPFDRGIFSVADVGILTDDSVNVSRIDMQIPNTVFNFKNTNEGVVRVQGIRDYFNELVYWTFPSDESTRYPDQVLVFNYRNNTYALFNDSFTCYGYYQRLSSKNWNQLSDITWNQWTTPWNSPVTEALFPSVVAGNQEGFVEIVTQDSFGVNDPSLFVDAIDFSSDPLVFTIPSHNLSVGEVIEIDGIIGTSSSLNGLVYRVVLIPSPDFVQLEYWDSVAREWKNPFLLAGTGSTYLGGGLVSVYNGINITTKIFAPFYDAGTQCRVGYVDFLFNKTDSGEVTSDFYINENNAISITDPTINSGLNGTNAVLTSPENTSLIPSQANQMKIWHRQFIQAIAQNFQVELSLSQEQLATPTINESDIVMHAMAFYLSPNARMTQ